MTTRKMKQLLVLYWLAAASLSVGGFTLFVVTQSLIVPALLVVPVFALIWGLTRIRCAACRFPVLYTLVDGWRSWPRSLGDTDPTCRKCGAKIATVGQEVETAG